MNALERLLALLVELERIAEPDGAALLDAVERGTTPPEKALDLALALSVGLPGSRDALRLL